jgi:hypothetical protein
MEELILSQNMLTGPTRLRQGERKVFLASDIPCANEMETHSPSIGTVPVVPSRADVLCTDSR